jgi:hypothetical protein
VTTYCLTSAARVWGLSPGQLHSLPHSTMPNPHPKAQHDMLVFEKRVLLLPALRK